MSDPSINREMAALLMRFGRDQVLRSFADLTNVSREELHRQLNRRSSSKAKRRPPKSVDELLNESLFASDDSRRLTIELAHAYENKRFLPDVRSVQIFLQCHAHVRGRIRSRTDALPRVIKVLAGLPLESLKEIAERLSTSGESDFILLARQIMGKVAS